MASARHFNIDSISSGFALGLELGGCSFEAGNGVDGEGLDRVSHFPARSFL
jgi:hypothetical protein